MEGPFPGLRELHKKLLLAAPLHEDGQASAALLMPCIPSEVGDGSAIQENVPVTNLCLDGAPTTWVPRDLTLLQLSLIQILIIKAENLCTESHIRCQYSQVVELLQQNGVDKTIIGLLNTSDKVLSHISSKCLSYLVLYQLKFQNEVNARWIQFCLNTLSEDPGSYTVMPCLMSLISVYKGILVDERIRKGDHLLQIMVALEDVFEGFCSTCMTECQPPLGAESSSRLSCLLDLLEVLVALRIELKLNVSLCKRVLSVILPQALNLMSVPVPYFVKKQVILVLKRCLLYKAGEDFLPSPHNLFNQQDAALDEELAVLATTLLNAVQQGWLLQVPSCGRSSSFGGANEGSEPGPDLVILGAASLSVLKALEIQFRNKACGGIGQGDAEFSEMPVYMAHLLNFLKRHLGWKEPVHFCEWVSLTFIEQDDDMLEVAKSLLQMYLHNPRLHSSTSGDENDIWKLPSHQCGMNPHCIFLLLLKNVLFDASVLLDFLISSETCFLEYFVRYLKLLKEDWPQFSLTCTFLDKSACLQVPSVANISDCPPQTVDMSRAQECSPHVDTSMVSGPKNDKQSLLSHCESSSSLGALQRLVEYDSSEDSESETSSNEPCLIIAQREGADSSYIDKQMKKLGLTSMCSAFYSTSASMQAASTTCQALGIQRQSAQCLVDLQEAISRLHRKKLFPYNPSALLKLLSHVCALSKE
ncbi:protein Lines homolog 1 [Eleutherodactylus coqui]|uniref:protein Lines homolog 1 n=1 Tax=Eleutherodactylus coqui TaxID=57060 RepID=UPI003462589E